MTPPAKKVAFAALALATTATIGLWAANSSAQNAAPNAVGPFNAAQVTAGQNAFIANCVACHGDNMTGQGEAPPLVGRGFMASWGPHTTKDLYELIYATMPFGAGGTLSAETYTNLVAFLLHANGARTGTTALTPTTAVAINTVATGTVPADITAGLKPVQVAQEAPAATGGANGGANGGGGNEARRAVPPSAMPAEYTNLGLIVPGNIKNYTDVTDAMLTNPSPDDWLMIRGNYQGWSYSKQSQITTANVNQLQLKWTLAMNDGGTNETTPLIYDGVMFLWSPGNTVQAINAKTGELLWQNNIGPISPNLNPGGDVAERAMGLYGNKVIVPTMQGKIYALDARTGKIVWQTFYSDPSKPDEGGDHGSDSGVIIVHGKILIGMQSCARIPQQNHCYISAYDANTGQRVWKFITVALTGQPGGDTWNNLADDHRAGAETWIAGSYDPELNTTYWGTAQAKPWRWDLRGTGNGATLYANSTLALDPDTGKLKWYFSHSPGETFDLDEVFERILVDHGDQKTVLSIGKPGILWKLDRATGKYLDSRQTVFQNVFVKIDPKTGTPVYRKDVATQTVDKWQPTCPGPEGGKDWPPSSYHQPSDALIIPLSQTCVLMLGSGAQQFYEMPGTEGNLGRLSAYKTSNLQPLWSLQQRSPFLTGVVSTAGNVAFVGDYDRVVHAFDTRTGRQLWTTRLGTGVEGHIASFAVDGKQYIAVMSGLGGSSPQQKPAFILGQEVNRPLHGNAVYVFGLPDNNQQAAN